MIFIIKLPKNTTASTGADAALKQPSYEKWLQEAEKEAE